MYALGIDLGTTFTAAAVWRDGRAEICSLGSRSAAIPSVVVLREDSIIVTGETADRRARSAPNRVAREFKRRLGDSTPILLGGVPYSVEALMARILRAVVDEVSSREGAPPSSVCVSHPANWGPYKIDLLQQAVRGADLENAGLSTEPEAAAVFYAGQERIADGSVIAVYDLGGGTFDTAVLRKSPGGFEILGRPEGIERLGGIDFDAAVYAHVSRSLGDALLDLDDEDPATMAAVSRLKEECTAAKEALSSDTDTTIPVLLPNLTTEVRLTRGELEAMVAPALEDTIGALRRALRSAAITPEELHSVLLVGGSSRMPVVAQLVAAELGRPVAVDVHPKHAVALGAALLAGGGAQANEPPTPEEQPALEETVHPAEPETTLPAKTEIIHPAEPEATPSTSQPRLPAMPESHKASAAPFWEPADASTPPPGDLGAPRGQQKPRWLNRLRAVGVAVGALIALATGTILFIHAHAKPARTVATAPCAAEIKANPRWVCLTKAVLSKGNLTISYDADFGAARPSVHDGYHLNIYGGDGVTPAAAIEGRQALKPGHWYESDQKPSVLSTSSNDYQSAIGSATKVCARIATRDGVLVKDLKGNYETGNCVPLKHT